MNIKVQLGLAAYKKAPEKNVQVFLGVVFCQNNQFKSVFEVTKIIFNVCHSQVYGFCRFGLANYWGGGGRRRMNVIVQLGLASHKKAFFFLFVKTIYYSN